MESQKTFEEWLRPFQLKMPLEDGSKVKKSGRECWRNCRRCPFHRPRQKERLCVFRECPFVSEMSTSTYFRKVKNRKRKQKRHVKGKE